MMLESLKRAGTMTVAMTAGAIAYAAAAMLTPPELPPVPNAPAAPAAPRAIAPRPALINHLAFFKLKNAADADELIRDCDELLGAIPGVVSYYAGKHLDTGRGERVDGGYEVGFYAGFNSREDLAAYVAHPNHAAAVEKWKARWEWIRVHDVIDPTP